MEHVLHRSFRSLRQPVFDARCSLRELSPCKSEMHLPLALIDASGYGYFPQSELIGQAERSLKTFMSSIGQCSIFWARFAQRNAAPQRYTA